MTAIIIYDEETPAEVVAKIAMLDGFRIIESSKVAVLRAPFHADELLTIFTGSVNEAPPPWQNATPYLRRKKGRR